MWWQVHVNSHVATCIDAAALTKKHILVAPVFFSFQWYGILLHPIKCSRIIIKLYTKIKRHIKNNNKNVKAHYAKTTKAVAKFHTTQDSRSI